MANNTHRNYVLILSVLFFVILGIAYLGYYWFYGRFYEYTDDAYVNGNMIFLTPQTSGIVNQITADNTDYVLEGSPLVILDTTDAQIKLNASISKLSNTVREVVQMFEKVKELEAELIIKNALFIEASQDFEHRDALIDNGAVSLEDFEHASAHLETTFADLQRIEHAYLGALAQVKNTTINDHPRVLYASEKLKLAYINLHRCIIVSPVTGLIAQRQVQVGKQVRVGEPLLAVIPLDQMWVDANFKEVQLSKIRIGQPVEMTADLWGSSVLLHGNVIGIGGGTGSVFSVLPPQNATGNWIKIVQRIPVRIHLNPQEIQAHPLRLGLSMEVTVDIHDTHLNEIPPVKTLEPLYTTDVFSNQADGINQLIQTIITNSL